MNDPIISICIPAYERLEFLDRLLQSIKIQTFKNFEVIITDDSKTEIVKTFIQNYNVDFSLSYYKNTPALGTAKNMLEGVKYARSQWIKIIHDDDFFSTENSLQSYANVMASDVNYIFSGYNEYFEKGGKKINKTISQDKYKKICRDPSMLFACNLIGAPSVLMLHKSVAYAFDEKLKWYVDMEYYYRVLAKEKTIYIDQPLINVSYNDTQVTNYTRTNPSVVIPEALHILDKHGQAIIHNIIAYDAWWRAFRNMGIRTIADLDKYRNGEPVAPIVKKMIGHQKIIPAKLIKNGIISKFGMGISYFLNKLTGRG